MHVTRCRVAWPAPALPLSLELLSARLSSSSFSIFSGPEDSTATVRLSLDFYILKESLQVRTRPRNPVLSFFRNAVCRAGSAFNHDKEHRPGSFSGDKGIAASRGKTPTSWSEPSILWSLLGLWGLSGGWRRMAFRRSHFRSVLAPPIKLTFLEKRYCSLATMH